MPSVHIVRCDYYNPPLPSNGQFILQSKKAKSALQLLKTLEFLARIVVAELNSRLVEVTAENSGLCDPLIKNSGLIQ